MFEIDKKEFGSFISELRKEKGMTQKELAEKLFVSDKAVSKWETGGSMPDITLLMPMAKIFEVTVPELLECRRYEKTEQITPQKAEAMMNMVIHLSDEEISLLAKERKKLQKWFVGAVIFCFVACLATYQYFTQVHGMNPMTQSMPLMFVIFGVVFGAYACFFERDRLPNYYDENKISAYSNGIFRMNLPGVQFNNSNWRYIVRTIRIWSISILFIGPVFWFITCLATFFTDWLEVFTVSSTITGTVLLVSIFVPIYVVAKKYE